MMNLFRLLPCIMIAGLAMLNPEFAHAQQLSHDPPGSMEESIPEEVSPSAITSVLPLDMNVYPLNTYYPTWDTLNVRRYADVYKDVNDSIIIPLVMEGHSIFSFPRNGKLLSPFGRRGRIIHAGVDLRLNLYDSVGAAFDGVVRMARYYHGYGNCVVIRHYNGLETLYGHLSKIMVRVGQPVAAGDLIGLGGHTGKATATHLHFETRFRGQAFNPRQLIDFDNFKLLKDTLVISNRTFGSCRDYMPGMSNMTASTDAKARYSGRSSRRSVYGSHYHTIKNGDTLGALASRYGTSVKHLCALNGIKSTKMLKLGTKIRIN